MEAAINYLLSSLASGLIGNSFYDLTKTKVLKLKEYIDEKDEAEARKVIEEALKEYPQLQKKIEERVEANEEYVKQQTRELEKFLNKLNESSLKTALVKAYFPQETQSLAVTSKDLAAIIRDKQKQAIVEQSDIKINKLANLLGEYIETKPFDTVLKSKIESLFALGTSLMLVDCKMDYTVSSGDNEHAHTVTVLEEGTLELVASLFYGTTPRLNAKNSKLGTVGQDMMNIKVIREEGWGDQQVAECAALEVYREVYKDEPSGLMQLPKLSRYIRNRRTKNKNLYYNMVSLNPNEKSELSNPKVLEHLKSEGMLPELPIFIMAQGEGNELMSEISAMLDSFYTDLSEWS